MLTSKTSTRTRNLSLPLRNLVSEFSSQGTSVSSIPIGVQPLQDIDEVNMFKDDNTVIHFKRPSSKDFKFAVAEYSDILYL